MSQVRNANEATIKKININILEKVRAKDGSSTTCSTGQLKTAIQFL